MGSLAIRISIITALAILIVMSALMLALEAERRLDVSASGQRLPWANQVVAIVELLEATPESQTPLALRALSNNALRVSVTKEHPSSEGTKAMPAATRILQGYLQGLGGRPVDVVFEKGGSGRPLLQLSGRNLWSSRPVRLVVGLKDGRWVVIEARSGGGRRLMGLRLSLIVLGVTILIAFAALWAVSQQLKPLDRLAKAVDQFGTKLETTTFAEAGPPEVRKLIKAFGLLQERIRTLLTGRTQMIAAIGHDFGTYLTRLRLRAEFISDPQQRDRASRDIEDMHALVSDALLLARLDSDTDQPVVTDLASLVRHHADGFAASGAAIHVDATKEDLPVRIKPTAIGRAFNNLVANALRYGSRADVTVRREGTMAELLVEDRGPGIPAAERQRVLEPFYRQDAARNLDNAGSGLGLSIVADVVRRSQGTLSLEDRPGGGLTARLRLPLAA